MNPKHRLAALALALSTCGITIHADAAAINKNSGATTPTLSDFSTAFARHPNKAGYGGVGDPVTGLSIASGPYPNDIGKSAVTVYIQKTF